jgi:hypothetical protein
MQHELANNHYAHKRRFTFFFFMAQDLHEENVSTNWTMRSLSIELRL